MSKKTAPKGNALRDAINARAEAAKLHGEESKEFAATDAEFKAEVRKLPKPKGSGPHWR